MHQPLAKVKKLCFTQLSQPCALDLLIVAGHKKNFSEISCVERADKGHKGKPSLEQSLEVEGKGKSTKDNHC